MNEPGNVRHTGGNRSVEARATRPGNIVRDIGRGDVDRHARGVLVGVIDQVGVDVVAQVTEADRSLRPSALS